MHDPKATPQGLLSSSAANMIRAPSHGIVRDPLVRIGETLAWIARQEEGESVTIGAARLPCNRCEGRQALLAATPQQGW